MKRRPQREMVLPCGTSTGAGRDRLGRCFAHRGGDSYPPPCGEGRPVLLAGAGVVKNARFGKDRALRLHPHPSAPPTPSPRREGQECAFLAHASKRASVAASKGAPASTASRRLR